MLAEVVVEVWWFLIKLKQILSYWFGWLLVGLWIIGLISLVVALCQLALRRH